MISEELLLCAATQASVVFIVSIPPVPVKYIQHAITEKVILISVDEFCTFVTCCHYHQWLDSAHAPMYACSHFWNRDVNVAAATGSILVKHIHSGHAIELRPAALVRGLQDPRTLDKVHHTIYFVLKPLPSPDKHYNINSGPNPLSLLIMLKSLLMYVENCCVCSLYSMDIENNGLQSTCIL
ncbi:hypothetical protein EDC96DRAFT_540205 [Choanephora cucurbitarum]|nr:hypothetical protein EDC96DRAFT_540205 [Choanephora cucurbitarum]